MREKGKIAASIMYMNLRKIILNFYMWMSWTVRLSQTLHMVRIL